MNDAKYIGLDVQQATISAAVLDPTGKLVSRPEALHAKADQTLPRLRGLESQKTTRNRRGIFS